MFHTIVSESNRIATLPRWVIFIGIALIWFGVQYYFFSTIGVKLVPDSIQRYIPYAKWVVNSEKLGNSQENRYLLYIILLALSIKAKMGLTAVVLFQIAISGIACIFLYKSIKLLTNQNRLLAITATLIFILWKDIQYLNVYILTESLFTSSIVVTLYFLIRSKNLKDYALACVLSMVPTLLRPNGFIILVGVLACIIFQHWPLLMKYRKTVSVIVSVCVISMIIILDNYLLTTFQIVETYARGEVIYASNIFTISANEVKLPNEKDSPILRILYFVLLNPIFFLKLFFAKLVVYIAYVKPYYSILHNLGIVLIIYPLYFFTGYNTLKSSRAFKVFAPTVFLLQALIVASTSEDWDSRFIIPILPVLIIFGTAGLHIFITRKIKTTILQSPAAL